MAARETLESHTQGILNSMTSGDDDEEVTEEEAMAVVDELLAVAKGGGKADSEGLKEAKQVQAATEMIQQGLRQGQLAVEYERRSNFIEALRRYDQSIDFLGQGIGQSNIKESVANEVLSRLDGYLARAQNLRLQAQPDVTLQPAGRARTFEAMANRGYGALARGVNLRKRAIALQSTEKWHAFVLLAEAIDCMFAYMKSSTKDGQASNPAVQKALLEMMDLAEALKQEVQSMTHT